MSEQSRVQLIGVMWFFTGIALAALFISAAAIRELTTGHIAIAFAILGLVGIASPFLLRWKGDESAQEKAKQGRIDKLLNDMSDDELVELKRRLSSVDVDDDMVVHSVGDDGELVRRK
jgi:hypothetical protein